MDEYRCSFCDKKLELSELVVSCEKRDRLFCASEHSPLEEGSCALRYLNENPEELKEERTYFFIRLNDK